MTTPTDDAAATASLGRPEALHNEARLSDSADMGGDAACWAHLVCPECDRLNEAERQEVCEDCGTRLR